MSDIESIDRKRSRGYSVLVTEQNEIRVLDLAPGRWDDRLRGSLRVVSLKRRPSYEALSYTWGRATDKSICIKISDFKITDNLFWALKRLRGHLARRSIWIDAICIDQGDDKERAQQVAMMGMIYRKATTVLVWLGDYVASSWSDPWNLRRPHFTREKGNPERRNHRGRKFAFALNAALRDSNPRWPDRAWVVQEFVLSQETLLCFGPVSIAFDPVHIIDLVLHSPEPLQYLREFHAKTSDMTKLKLGTGDVNQSIGEACLYTSNASCKDPRDRVYSIMSLIDRKESQLIEINYNEPPAETYARATFASMKAQQDLGIMDLVAFKEPTIENLPTWVVDFSLERDYVNGRLQRESWERISLSSARHPSGDHPRLSTDSKCLTVVGVLFDRIEAMKPMALVQPFNEGPRTLNVAEDLVLLLETAFRRRRYEHSAVRQRSTSDDSIERSMLHSGNPKTTVAHLVTAAFTLWDKVAGPNPKADDRSWQSSWKRDFPERNDGKIPDTKRPTYLQYADAVSDGAFLFTTLEGYIGIAPLSLGMDDEIFVLENCSLPVILRKAADVYSFRGLAWVHGIMDGEPIEPRVGQEYGWQEYILE